MLKLASLHCNTEYSFQESTIRIDALINFALKHDLKELVITDHNVMHGAFEFIEKCQKNKIKPIVGLDLDVEEHRLILLAKNYLGFQKLVQLSSTKMLGEQILLTDINSPDLVVIDHPTHGFYAKNKRAITLKNFYIATENKLENAVDCLETRFLLDEELEAVQVLNAQQTATSLKSLDLQPYRFEYEESDSRVARNQAILEMCQLEIPTERSFLPVFKTPNGESSNKYLSDVLKENFSKIESIAKSRKHGDRVKHEYEIIKSLNFADYFLIIWDLVKWSKENGIGIGPGRGSAAGSLIAFVLNITEVNPLKYDLLFERFLNPQRVSMPDIDIDIQDDKRHLVLAYLFEKYGKEYVAQISTFSTLGAKSSLRDVGRIMNIETRLINNVAKLIPAFASLDEAYKTNVKFRAAIEANAEMQLLFKRAKLIEGLPRQTGTHAAGIVISSEKITSHFPVCLGSDNLPQVQMSMDYLEKNGLVKIDLLSLRNITILESIKKQVETSYQRKLDLKRINFTDQVTNELLSNADTYGVFQLESHGMRNALSKVGIDSLDDLVAVLALFRPGPMEQIGVYAERKKGAPIPKVDPVFDKITKNTYGIIVYQEQIMFLAQEYASMTFAEADLLRRAISKKSEVDIASLKQTFLQGARKNGHVDQEIENIYNLIEKFADYGFNKSHAVAYAILAYQIAFLKAHFPKEFYLAIINSSLHSEDLVKRYVTEMISKGIQVESPTINLSTTKAIFQNEKIILPFSIIKGVGEMAIIKVLDERAKGLFTDFHSTVARLKTAGIGEAVLRLLIQSNSFREFGNMQTLLDNLMSALRYTDIITITKQDVESLDFSLVAKPKLVEQKRNLVEEMHYEEELFGFTLNVFKTMNFENENKLVNLQLNKETIVVFSVDNYKILKDKNGNEFAIAMISDSSCKKEMVIFAGTWKIISNTPKGSIVKAKIIMKDFNNKNAINLVASWEILQ